MTVSLARPHLVHDDATVRKKSQFRKRTRSFRVDVELNPSLVIGIAVTADLPEFSARLPLPFRSAPASRIGARSRQGGIDFQRGYLYPESLIGGGHTPTPRAYRPLAMPRRCSSHTYRMRCHRTCAVRRPK